MSPGARTPGDRQRAPGPVRLVRSPSIGTVEDSYSAHFHLSRLGRQPDGALPIEGLRMSQAFEHRPVMVSEVVDLFAPVPPGLVVDATVGGGGHAAALLAAHPHLRLLGLDQDDEAVAAAVARLAPFGGRATVRRARFDLLPDLLTGREGLSNPAAPPRRPGVDGGDVHGAAGAGPGGRREGSAHPGFPPPGWAGPRPGPVEAPAGPLVGALFDLGLSSPHVDRPDRGFSYRREGPLDMRMDRRRTTTAGDLVNTLPEADLAALLAAGGEERFARAIARAVVSARPLGSTTALAETVAAAVPARARRRGHPATRVFQALRIAVNDELGVLEAALTGTVAALAPGGRCVVLSYHSGEDRLVKAIFAHAATGGCTCPVGLDCVCGARPWARLLNRGARLASREEVAANPRASAARLRAVERLEAPAPSGGGPR